LPPFDLNKAIDMPANEILYPKEVSDFLSFLNSYTEDVTKDERDEIKGGLSSATELCEVEVMENVIDSRLSRKVAEDKGMKLIVSKLTEMRKELQELEGDEE
jgi:hypothetical protein